MRRVIVTAAIAGSLLAIGPAQSASAAAPIRECGNPPGIARNLTTRGASCATARQWVRWWYRGRVPRYIDTRERVRVRGCSTITDARLTIGPDLVVRFQAYGRACD